VTENVTQIKKSRHYLHIKKQKARAKAQKTTRIQAQKTAKKYANVRAKITKRRSVKK